MGNTQAQQYQALLINPIPWHSTTSSSVVQLYSCTVVHIIQVALPVVSYLNTDGGNMVGPCKFGLFE